MLSLLEMLQQKAEPDRLPTYRVTGAKVECIELVRLIGSGTSLLVRHQGELKRWDLGFNPAVRRKLHDFLKRHFPGDEGDFERHIEGILVTVRRTTGVERADERFQFELPVVQQYGLTMGEIRLMFEGFSNVIRKNVPHTPTTEREWDALTHERNRHIKTLVQRGLIFELKTAETPCYQLTNKGVQMMERMFQATKDNE